MHEPGQTSGFLEPLPSTMGPKTQPITSSPLTLSNSRNNVYPYPDTSNSNNHQTFLDQEIPITVISTQKHTKDSQIQEAKICHKNGEKDFEANFQEYLKSKKLKNFLQDQDKGTLTENEKIILRKKLLELPFSDKIFKEKLRTYGKGLEEKFGGENVFSESSGDRTTGNNSSIVDSEDKKKPNFFKSQWWNNIQWFKLGYKDKKTKSKKRKLGVGQKAGRDPSLDLTNVNQDNLEKIQRFNTKSMLPDYSLDRSQYITNSEFEQGSSNLSRTNYATYLDYLMAQKNKNLEINSDINLTLDSLSKDSAHTQQYLISKSEILSIFTENFHNGLLGTLSFILLMSNLLTVILAAGHLAPSELFVSVMGICGAYFSQYSCFIWGFNISFNIIISRLFRMGDHISQNKYMKKQLQLTFWLSVLFGVLGLGFFYGVEWIYAKNDLLMHYSKLFTCLSVPSIVVLYFVGVFRELFLGCQMFGLCFQIETFILALTAGLVWVLSFQMGFHFYGMMWGFFIGQVLALAVYALCYLYCEDFQEYHKNVELANYYPNLTTMQHCEEISNKVIKNLPREYIGHSWPSYIKYGFSYALISFFDSLWLRLDVIITSLIVPITNQTFANLAAQMGLLIIANIIECFSYGFGITITSKISKLMVLQDFRRAKLTTVIVLLQVLQISVVISLMIFVFRENIARLFIANGDSQLILVEILRLYCLILPFQLLRGALQSVNRSIGNGTIMFMVDLWANYILHAIAIYLFYRYSYSFDIVDLKIIKSTCICWAVFVSFVASCLGGFLVMIFTNWKRESSRVKNSADEGMTVRL